MINLHVIKIKIYYEDTDAGGVVYHANYLKYLERARTEFLNNLGINIAEYHRKGILFVVSHIDISYKRPASLGDVIDVYSEIYELRGASMTIKNTIKKSEHLLCEALVNIACVNSQLKPMRLPKELIEAIKK